MHLRQLDRAPNDPQAGIAHQVLAQLFLLLVAVLHQHVLVVATLNARFHVDVECLGDELEEEDASQDFAEVKATLLEQAVLRLEELSLLVDVLVDLRHELRRSHIGSRQYVLDLLIEFLDFGGRAKIDEVVGVDLLDRLNLLVGLFSAFEKLGEGQLVGHDVLVEVDVVHHFKLEQVRDNLVTLVIRNHDLQECHVFGS